MPQMPKKVASLRASLLPKTCSGRSPYSRTSEDGHAATLPAGREEFESPVSKVQIKEVIHAVENIESEMQAEMRRNNSRPHQYKVHESPDDTFLPERPIREGEEYVVGARTPESYFLPPNQQPLTLQSVMRPNLKGKPGPRPPFRRPQPPEIKLRRPPPPNYQKNTGYPLPMPGPHGMHKKHPMKHPIRMPIGPIRPPPPGAPPKTMQPPMHSKPVYPMKHINKHPMESPVQSVIVGKPGHGGPSQVATLNLGQTDIIMNQIVRSQITLPGAGDAATQQVLPQTNLNRQPAGQIILGRPMDNPMPLDQQMSHTLHTTLLSPPAPKVNTQVLKIQNTKSENPQTQSDVKSSDFMGESVETSTIVTAVNTGFKPNSIVIESGFKPIIREPLMAGEDRITNDEDNNANRREDTDVEEDYEEAPQYINHVYPSDKMTQSFEPMFIPSPPDHVMPTEDRTREVFPSNHAKEDRPHPVYIKTEEQLNALFGKTNMNREVPLDLVMESNKVSPQYLPPDPKLPKEHSQKLSSNQETYTTYDGKTVSAATLTKVPEVRSPAKLYSSKLPVNSELLLKTPQFGQFKGDIPPLVGARLDTDVANSQPPSLGNSKTTNLKLVNAIENADEPKTDDLLPSESKTHEVKPSADSVKDEEEIGEEYDDDDYTDSRRKKRDTKQFEKGVVEEQKYGESSRKNQADWSQTSSGSIIWNSLNIYCLVLTVLAAKFV